MPTEKILGHHLVVEFGESVEECAKRELVEETSLHAKEIQLGPWIETIFDKKRHYITFVVFVTAFEGEPIACEREKCS